MRNQALRWWWRSLDKDGRSGFDRITIRLSNQKVSLYTAVLHFVRFCTQKGKRIRHLRYNKLIIS